MAIRTPRPRPVSEPTLIGGLARTASSEIDRRRQLRLEDEERARQREFEDLRTRGERQRQGVEFQTFLRNVRGEEIVGGGGPVPGTVTDFSQALQPRESIGRFAEGAPPQALAPRPGALTGVQAEGGEAAGAVGAGRRAEQARRRGAILEPARATRPQFQESEIRRLDPDRDPTQLVRREEPSPNLGFASIERRLRLPPNALEESFRQNAPATLRLVLEDSLGEGGRKLNAEELNDLRLFVDSRVRAIQVQMEAVVEGDDPEVEALMSQLREELDELTVGLIQAKIGSPDFSQEDAADEIDRMFPDASDEDKAERLVSAVRAAGRAARFAGRARGSLTPRR